MVNRLVFPAMFSGVLITLSVAVYARADDLDADASNVLYNRDVRSILAEHCFACHGPDDEHREGDLRLDIRDDVMHAGVIKPGDSAESELVKRLVSIDSDEVMPPPESGTLSQDEKDILVKWIDGGAEYQKHWAFEPVMKATPPRISDELWCQNPIDRFILKRLENKGLRPSLQANRAVLIKRLYIDLIGLLPTPDQVDAFLADGSATAYESIVDELLRSKHYGERWGRHWLDQARYADSNGYTFDNARVMWPYRDWVIDAVNQDMPFNEFTIQQLAGDLLSVPTTEQITATGFHRNTLINEEGGTDAEQFRVEAVIDRTNTTGTVWLALTVGCAQCHNHKFDPVSQRDYYSLFAFFNSTVDRNNRGPEITVRNPHAEEIVELERQLAALKIEEKERGDAETVEPRKWSVLTPLASKAESKARFETLQDQSLLVSGPNAIQDVYDIVYQVEKGKVAAFQINVLPHETLPKGGPGRASNGNFVMVDVQFDDADGNKIQLDPLALADYSQSRYDVSLAVDRDLKSGWAINTNQKGNVSHWAKFLLAEPILFQKPTKLRLRMRFNQGTHPYNLGRFQLSTSPVRPAAADLIVVRRSALEARKKTLEAGRVKSMVMRELDKPRVTHLLTRGDFLRPAESVEPAVLKDLYPWSQPEQPVNRLDLARWLVDPGNPLTPRVAVNRMWQKFFGVGLVETVEDFGMQGSVPSHAELLDWMATEFVERGWSRKQIQRLIVTSATYRQASDAREDLQEKDPLNRLLGRQNRLRVDAEIVRDLALSASGTLTATVGGPSVYPPQPAGVYAFTQKKKNWPTSQGPDRFRRTMYTFFYRSSPHPMLTVFDAPRFNVTCTRRGRSNTPLQSLMVANDPGLFELAEALSDRAASEQDAVQLRLKYMFRLALCRQPTPKELRFLQDFLEDQRGKFSNSDTGPNSKAVQYAWIAVARVLMNLDEFITRE
ncbi:PSD1 and planctomycete cytochrome C domain-containing protein [Rubripirellula sp.]|nr:PSD1 and planctomycete cytochrome C domain-containing protein [Rubripirellula sp.]MDB4621370.1 PSD1 and planctomycete cytochrome C domain-containing protein [Rubripirellula sp.]